MPRDWAGESERDRSLQAHVESLVLPPGGKRPAPHHPLTLVLGPRGSGKTTLLRALARWAGAAPMVRLDCADVAQRDQRPVDLLRTIAFGLEPRKKHVPRLSFRVFRLVSHALTTEIDPEDRAAARRRLTQELAAPPAQWLADLTQVAEAAGSIAGLPAALTSALQLLPLGERHLSRTRVRHAVGGLRRSGDLGSGLDALIELNLAHNSGPEDDRRPTERLLGRVFLDELRRAYTGKDWAVRCLVLLDNVDTPLGGELLRLLLSARSAAAPDPLVVLAMAGSYPDALRGADYGGPYAVDDPPPPWPPGTPFTPRPVTEGLRVGRLRDLSRSETEQQAKDLLQSVHAPAPRGDTGARWLGWAVHEITRGQPAGTARLLDALRDLPAALPWDARLRTALAPEGPLAPALLRRLLPIDPPEGLPPLLSKAAAAPDLAQALASAWVRDETADHVRAAFHAFCRDPLRTQHPYTPGAPGTGGPRDTGAADSRPSVPHPLLRRLLLDALEEPAAVHTRLRAEAAGRGEHALAAYHALAGGDLPAAAALLDATFEQGAAEDWCAALCRLRRAPLPPPDPAHRDTTPWRRYESLVRHLDDESVAPRLRTITRLLAASWIAPEPPEAPATDRVQDPYRDPLGDLHASLYAEVNARFHTLATAHTERAAWTAVLLDKADQYTKEPWR